MQFYHIWCKLYNSCLNEIPLFNVADWQLPQDVMHVLLERVLPLQLKLLLHNFTAVQNLFTVEDFNSRVESFQFGYSECMSPSISLMTVSYLSELIRIYLGLFIDCYPTTHITPKQHYMVHFPEQIRRYYLPKLFILLYY